MIYFTRHGETLLNRRGCYYGSMDVPLTARGRSQAENLGRKLANHQIQRVYSSSLSRCQVSAALITDQWLHPVDWVTDPRLNERDFGLWEGLIPDEVAEKDPDNWQHFLQAPFQACPQGGEAFSDFQVRVLAFKDQLLKSEQNQPRLVVSHLGVLRSLLQALDPSLNYWQIQLKGGEVCVYDDRTGRIQWEN